MAEYPTTPFERAVDKAIARENARVEASLCPGRAPCRRCGGSGRREVH